MIKIYLKTLPKMVKNLNYAFNALLLVFFVFSVSEADAQYCLAATSNETIVPTGTSQNTTTYNSGARAFNFDATAGCTYTFSTCGLAPQDTYLRLYSTGTGGTALVSADDQCGLQSSFTWTCITSGTYSVLLTNYPCNPLTSNTTMSYIRNSCTLPNNPTSISATVPSFCASALGSTTLTANGPIGTVYWFTGACNTSGEFATGNSVSVSPAVTTTYYARNFSGGQWSAGCASITINVNASPNAPTLVTASPAVLCSGGSSNLNATSAGNVINWFTVPSGGVSIGSSASGANFSVSPGSTTTYYAESQSVGGSGTQTFNLTGGTQTFTVPAGVTSINIEAWGAEGGSALNNASWDPLFQMGGNGGYSSGTLAVTPGQVLHVYVGGRGNAGAAGGFNGGGSAAGSDPNTTSSGGGASDIRILPGGLANRVLVAGGGGGAEWAGGGNQAGQGGGLTGGVNGGGDSPAASGNPGTQVAAGTAGSDPCGGSFGPTSGGAFGVGGNSVTGHSGGGGGGWYGGGGGGCDGHGGGGSSYIGGVTGGNTIPGVRNGDGQIIITWTGGSGCSSATRTAVTVTVAAAPTASISTTSSTVCHGIQATLSGPVTATGAWTVTLSNGQTATGTGNGTWSIVVSPTTTTTYTLTSITDASSCPGSVSGSVTLTLPTAGSTLGLNNESATCVVNQNGWIHFYHSSGRLLASVNSLGQNLGNVTVTSYVDGSPLSVPACDFPLNADYTTAYMQRHWVITPTIQPSVPVQVRLPFGNGEFASLVSVANTNPNSADDLIIPNDLKLTKYSGPLNVNNSAIDNCVSNGGSGGATLHTQVLTGATTGYSSVTGAAYTDFSIPGFSEFWLHGSQNNSPLPVEMSNMQVNCDENNDVLVTWTTQSEFNTSHFAIEQSRNGQDWQLVASTQAAGNSSVVIDYSVSVNDFIGGISYYRIVQFDNNGEFNIYGPLSTTCKEPLEDGLINLYPNPSDAIVYVNYMSTEEYGSVELIMYDGAGSIIKKLYTSLVKGNNTLILNNYEVAPGMYFIQLVGETFQSDKVKLIKQ
jgi:hypothetical protein